MSRQEFSKLNHVDYQMVAAKIHTGSILSLSCPTNPLGVA
jgi:hypothetical protein